MESRVLNCTNYKEELKQSAKEGNLLKVKKLLGSKKLNPILGQTLLYCAIRNGHIAVAEEILQHGYRIRNDLPFNELHVALWNHNIEMIEMLLNYGANFTSFTFVSNEDLQRYGDMGALIRAIKLKDVTTAEEVIQIMPLTERLKLEIFRYATFREAYEIVEMLLKNGFSSCIKISLPCELLLNDKKQRKTNKIKTLFCQ